MKSEAYPKLEKLIAASLWQILDILINIRLGSKCSAEKHSSLAVRNVRDIRRKLFWH
jgi:hypothetical protein